VPVCGWCGKFNKHVEEVDNGATILLLCPFCFAQYEIKQGKELSPADFSRPPGLLERLKRWLFRR
jgi:hypothetical protein